MKFKRVIYSSENLDAFSTFEVHDVDSLLNLRQSVEGAKEFISDIETKQAIGDDTFKFIDEAYDYLGGFKSFKDKDKFISDSYLWYITYQGSRPSKIVDFDADKVLVVSVYRKSHGLKLVGIARRNIKRPGATHQENQDIQIIANSALAAHLRFMDKHGWAEVSDNLEKWCIRILGYKEVIDPQWLIDNKIFKDIELDHYNDYYYFRPLRKGGPMLHKIAFGNPKLN